MRARNNVMVWLGWTGALLSIFTMMSACSDPPPDGTGAGASGSTSSSGTAGGGGSAGGSVTCGNGVLDAMEACDPGIAAGSVGACPTTCNDNAACTLDKIEGEACTAICTNGFITTCQGGDGCCPASCKPEMDSDCSKRCGDGVKDPNETCDKAIAAGSEGSCFIDCNDGVACTTDSILNAGTCSAECVHGNLETCIDGDGCCPANCPMDSDCIVLSRIRQTVITDVGDEWWLRNGYWDSTGYKNWTPFTGQGLGQLVAAQPAGQTYRSVDFVVLGSGEVQMSVVQLDGKKVWSRLGKWYGNAYSSWTTFAELALNPPAGVTDIRSFDQVVFPDERTKQTIVTWDGKTAYYRYADWDPSTKTYINWTTWTNQYGDLKNAASFPAGGSFRSFNHVMLADNRIKQALLSEDGHTVWYRYGAWDGMKFGNWTSWDNQWGNLTGLVPGRGDNQTYLTWDEAALAGSGIATGCQNGCDDNDPCTVDSCSGNSCVHVLKSCNDGNLCTDDTCVNGACQNVPINCDDGQGCTIDSCEDGVCKHSGANCEDGNPCTDDSCNGGSCSHNNNSAACGNGGTCQNGSCQAGGSSSSSSGGSSGGPCVCTVGCTDSCGQPCNQAVDCATNAFCWDGVCQCFTNSFCGGKCCNSGDFCGGNGGTECCAPDWKVCDSGGFSKKCGLHPRGGTCGNADCGGCNPNQVCMENGRCGAL